VKCGSPQKSHLRNLESRQLVIAEQSVVVEGGDGAGDDADVSASVGDNVGIEVGPTVFTNSGSESDGSRPNSSFVFSNTPSSPSLEQ
jgi:hypothetical protein